MMQCCDQEVNSSFLSILINQGVLFFLYFVLHSFHQELYHSQCICSSYRFSIEGGGCGITD